MRLSMVKVVAFSEYSRRMKQRGFLLSSLLLPLVVVAGIAIAGFLGTSAESVSKPLGVVDEAGILGQPSPLPEEGARSSSSTRTWTPPDRQ